MNNRKMSDLKEMFYLKDMISKNGHIFLETTLNNWQDIFKLNQKFLEKFIFRGQANKEWGLSTSLERLMVRLYPKLIDSTIKSTQEKKMIEDFQWKYPLYSNSSIDTFDFVEWLAVMQHYGSATRLLDFSYSFFVALYMAVYDNGCDNSVWAINRIPIESQSFTEFRKRNNVNRSSSNTLKLFSLELGNEAIKESFKQQIERQLFIIEPKNSNERLARQQGLFLMPSDVKCTFFDCLIPYLGTVEPVFLSFQNLIEYSHEAKYNQEDITLIKIVIPKENNFMIVEYLRKMNLTAEILFPGLEGLGESMNYLRTRIGQKNE